MDDLSNPSIPWQRKLLSLAEETDTLALPVAVTVGIAATVSIIIVVAMCVCGDAEVPELKEIKPRKGPSSMSLANAAAPVQTTSVKLEASPEVQVPEAVNARPENGLSSNRHSGAPSRSSQISVGSGQARPPSLRELPELPVGDIGRPLSGVENGVPHRITEDDDDYDHLGKERQPGRGRANYDHIKIESPNGTVARDMPPENETPSGENYYAQLRDRNYETVTEVKRRVVDPYDQVNVCDDPYTGLKDDPYAKVKDDPYAKVKDDPYEKVKDDDTYAKVKDNDVSNQVHITNINVGGSEIDPYSTLGEETEVSVMDARSSRSSTNLETGSRSSAANVVNFEDLPQGALGPHLPEPNDDYAVVNKPRNASASNEVQPSEEVDPYVIPPEPPRAYTVDEAAAQPSLVGAVGGGASRQDDNPEREYTMVTARESLASMTARNALNPYETVPETENMYATVDGGSGDGVVQRKPAPPTQEVVNQAAQRLSAVSETYAEIDGNYATAAAPAPPSLDSLHMMTKQQEDRRHLASPEDSGISGSSNDYAIVDKRSSFSPSATRLPEIPNSPVLPTAAPIVVNVNGNAEGASNGVTLDPNYQTVKDCITYIDENDPNYESVEEAKAKQPSKRDRRHVYEEVSPTNPNAPGFEAASEVRERVLQGHMYEDIHELKEQQRKSKRRPAGGSEKS
ncbi:uncharacterized protein LOC124147672 [Haliotis rufescens]|uniref:uncharacterized protein LOC124147672 n=1 Tax=Haliotis rufescens TaxID=6454 RepID=UPI00201F8DBD|nr:uncharacterized protein LOC124147672 [Haliotis rufescens]XP_046374351.2 uncharacterized protein LOC124147672 [Haliotis rufescens]XP_048238377.1 uncharacterized protein LOC124147672 [Haliotis rufescens]